MPDTYIVYMDFKTKMESSWFSIGLCLLITAAYIVEVHTSSCLKLYDESCTCHTDCCSNFCKKPFDKILTQRTKGVCKLLSNPQNDKQYAGYVESGKCSYYDGYGTTANGENFNQHDFTAAHRTLPFNMTVHVEYEGHSVDVRINDRGPFIDGRILDLSLGAANQLGMVKRGVIPCTISVIDLNDKVNITGKEQ